MQTPGLNAATHRRLRKVSRRGVASSSESRASCSSSTSTAYLRARTPALYGIL